MLEVQDPGLKFHSIQNQFQVAEECGVAREVARAAVKRKAKGLGCS